jgi:hypothetical protein
MCEIHPHPKGMGTSFAVQLNLFVEHPLRCGSLMGFRYIKPVDFIPVTIRVFRYPDLIAIANIIYFRFFDIVLVQDRF